MLFALVDYDIWNDLGTAKDKIQKFETSIKVFQDSMKVMRKEMGESRQLFQAYKTVRNIRLAQEVKFIAKLV